MYTDEVIAVMTEYQLLRWSFISS